MTKANGARHRLAKPRSLPARQRGRQPPSLARCISTALLTGILSLVLLALAMPALVGFYLEREHQRLVAALDVPGVADFETTVFTRGWFRSRLRLRMIPQTSLCPAAACPPPILDSVIYHGPVAWAAPPNPDPDSPLVLAVVASRLPLGPFFGALRVRPKAPELQIVTRIGLMGDARIRAHLPRAELRLPAAAGAIRLASSPLWITAELSANASAVPVTIEWARFALVAERGGQIAFQDLSASFVGHRRADDFWQRYQGTVKDLRLAGLDGEAVAIHGLALTADVEDGSAGRFSLRISRLGYNGNEYGPALVDGRLALAAPQSAPVANLPPLPRLVLVGSLAQDPWARILAAGPSLRVQRLLLGTPWGDVRATMALGVRAQALGGQAKLGVPKVILESLVAAVLRHRYPELPDPTPGEVEARINNWLVRGFIAYQEADNAYAIEVVIDGGDLRVGSRTLNDWGQLFGELDQGIADQGAKQ